MSTTQNLTLLTDLYELTMMQGYLKNPVQETVIFDVFYRNNPCGNGFAIAAGLDQMIDYIKNIDERFDKDRVVAFKEKFMSACDGHATERIENLVFGNALETYHK